MSQPPDPDVSRIGHDPDAFEAFYRAHVEAIQRFVARRVEDPYLAADLTAEVFLAAIDSARTYRASRGQPIGWLYGVARNVMAAERRRSARALRAGNRVAGRALVDGDDLVRLEERIDAEARTRALYRAMDELSEAERAVLELVALDGLAVQEAAKALGIRPVTARVRLHRARQTLKERLSPATAEQLTILSEASS
ncbi:RNA polymerase sigma factor [Fodinicola feengrottensis]|uniref:Sigma-70 family RNA polymerase sigma factor n=1 Tax=Fodinicola feengrottensis TaxID=435914 RepID=A0ABN2IJS4_9ACTN|nr:sigma-70 family RNA polymerase sigma factor [Fodinicola feengrottensis]